MRRHAWGFVLLVLCGVSAHPAAQTLRPANEQTGARVAPRPLVRPPGPRVRAYFLVDTTVMTAVETFDAVFGTPNVIGYGGGVDVLRLWKGLFARVAVSDARRDGERVVVVDGDGIPLGIPLQVQMTPIEIATGWRTDVGRRRQVGVYAGGGLLRMRYRETSEFSETGDDTDESFGGYLALAGFDVGLGRWVMVGAEGQYRTVPDAIGAGGASAAFGETDLGGFTLRVMVGIKH